MRVRFPAPINPINHEKGHFLGRGIVRRVKQSTRLVPGNGPAALVDAPTVSNTSSWEKVHLGPSVMDKITSSLMKVACIRFGKPPS